MTTNDLLSLLSEHKEKELLFEYKENAFVAPSYHITEIMNINIDSVDCGGKPNRWNETVVQLWESPKEREKTKFLTVGKGLSIFERVDAIKPMDREAEILFEYGNAGFHTAKLFVNGHESTSDRLILKLGVEKTQCKALTEALATIGSDGAKCAPNSGCC